MNVTEPVLIFCLFRRKVHTYLICAGYIRTEERAYCEVALYIVLCVCVCPVLCATHKTRENGWNKIDVWRRHYNKFNQISLAVIKRAPGCVINNSRICLKFDKTQNWTLTENCKITRPVIAYTSGAGRGLGGGGALSIVQYNKYLIVILWSCIMYSG